MALVNEIVAGLIFAEGDLSNPVFTWTDGNDYPCVPSIAEVARDLDTGGFTIDRVLTMSARLLDVNLVSLYTGALPAPQEVVTYNGDRYRIINTKKHPTGAYLRITAMGITRGI